MPSPFDRPGHRKRQSVSAELMTTLAMRLAVRVAYGGAPRRCGRVEISVLQK